MPNRPITIYSEGEIRAIERAADSQRAILRELADAVVPGIQTIELDALARTLIARLGAEALFEGYRQGGSPPFPSPVCVSVNDEVVHGIPGDRVIEAGDLVSIDVGIRLDGWCADSGTCVVAGGGAGEAAELVAATRRVLDLAIESVRAGVRWSEIARELERVTFGMGLGIVTQYVGHGIGRELHEPPKVPAFWEGFHGSDFTLEVGQVLAIEPILTGAKGKPGPARIRLARDGWTVTTEDGVLAAHEERMIVVEPGGARRLGVDPLLDV
ncbi:MAG: type I methionyl aminopeptidase [Planctomycetota bacterium]